MSQEIDAALMGMSYEEARAVLGDELAASLLGPLPNNEAIRTDVQLGQDAAQGMNTRPLDSPRGKRVNIGRPISVQPGVPGLALDVTGADELSETLTITLLYVAPPYPNGNKTARVVPPDATAKITWGNGGVLATARVDMREGLQLSLCASTCRVEIEYPGPPGSEPLSVSAFIAYGQRPQSEGKRPVLTLDATVANGGAVSFTIPEFAYDVEVYSDTAAATLTITQNNPAGALVQVLKTAAQSSARMVLVRQAYFLDVANTGAAPVGVSAVFGIDL